MKRYNPKEIEPKWQKAWAEKKTYAAVDFDERRPKYIILTEFPYPSGVGIHLGHTREYTLGDIMARHKRMTGHNVLFPMGYDEFGLPTENFAIKNKISPQKATSDNVSNFQRQLEAHGFSIDWARAVRTSDPKYYKWTQWLFLQFYEAGLAYQAEIPINWCPKCKTGLANEEVVNGRHERCGTLVEKKILKQWLFKITEYADRLIKGLETVDFPSRIADQQVNWIGRSVGAEVDFKLEGINELIKVFTTRPDTLFGATFMVLAPEHPLVAKLTVQSQKKSVEEYVKAAQAKSDIERQETEREKTGVFTGTYAINPVNNEKIPVWIADYVLMGYGTGAIMAVPAHDERDYEFAKKFDLPIQIVVEPVTGDRTSKADEQRESIVAIVKDPKNDTYLSIRWKTSKEWHLFIGGGLEAGEKPEVAAEREIKEETGYQNLKLIKTAPYKVHHTYYSEVKDRIRSITSVLMLFELTSENRRSQQLEAYEEGKFDVVWLSAEQIERQIQDELHIQAYKSLVKDEIFSGEGLMVNSGSYNGLSSHEAREQIVGDLAKKGSAAEKVNYKLRDWIFSRQHYWGEPIPIIHCPKCGALPVPEDQLPIELPAVKNYEPTDTGESPLAFIEEWVNTTCPKCGGPAKRETDTMPNWAGSSWYYLRYFDAHNDEAFADRKKLEYWGMVDMYLGSMEHTTLHLLYSRFWHQFLYDKGLVPTPEPYSARRGQGIILASDGTKMSKSKGNVIDPTEIIDNGYGADALRVLIVFLAPYDMTTPWNESGIAGTHRFLNRVWTLAQEYLDHKAEGSEENVELITISHKAIKKVSQDLHEMSFNTAVAALMEHVNELYKIKAKDNYSSEGWKAVLSALLQLLAPFAPHIAEELWQQLGNEGSIHTSTWPVHDEKYLVQDTMTIVVQVNGKVRANIEVPANSTEKVIVETSQKDVKAKAYLENKTLRKTIYVPGRLVNFVV